MLRRRKAAALMIQSVFRGFSQRKKWHAIIRLRTSWGNTRIVTHSFVVWRDRVALTRRVRAFAFRFRNRSKANCLKALLWNVVERQRLREELLRDRLRRVSEGVRLRVFEAWVRYAETSLAIKRLRYRSSVRPSFRGWWEIASRGRMHSRLCWACATLVSRLLRWKTRSHYTKLRGSCVKIQTVAKIQMASSRIKKKARASRISRAEEAVQALEVSFAVVCVWVATYTLPGFRASPAALSLGDILLQTRQNTIWLKRTNCFSTAVWCPFAYGRCTQREVSMAD